MHFNACFICLSVSETSVDVQPIRKLTSVISRIAFYLFIGSTTWRLGPCSLAGTGTLQWMGRALASGPGKSLSHCILSCNLPPLTLATLLECLTVTACEWVSHRTRQVQLFSVSFLFYFIWPCALDFGILVP